jgi:serine protease Do
MSNYQLTEAIERYLHGEMSTEERAHFDQLRKENADIDSKIAEHLHFSGLLNQYRERLELENKLNAIHSEIDVHALVEEMTVHPSWIVQMWRNHHSKISVAASIAIFAVLTIMFSTGYFKSQPNVQQLSAKINQIENSTNQLKTTTGNLAKEIHKPRLTNPGNYRGSGFALSSNGYIVTNYHVIFGDSGRQPDSVYVQNAAGDSFRANVVYSEPLSDITILKINDSSFDNLPALPYNLKRAKSDIGENVFTIGYPEGDAPVMDQGYVSSINGSRGDSSQYRVSIAVNPGNSGGPLVNSKGSIIGIVSGRQRQTEGASYAIKAVNLYKAIQNVPQDSLSSKFSLSNKNTLAGLSRVQQIKKMQNYVFMVKVY